ncbi:phage portal protein [Streptomyces sp. NBC_00237]|uniref:phage portal protein n=1 Tax=Streptomyces sp. NBC_00237 TaxID=2975687 RepID=UPI00224D14EB|nr:phage portal protein [Streptomyces sp. NBC_00237]MCX5203004.1 phage portal protein [Streptomyces sp. NBC_00237]
MAFLEDLIKAKSSDEQYLNRVHDYMQGNHPMPWIPSKLQDQFRAVAKRAKTNYMPKVVGSIAENLSVVGYREPRSGSESPAWKHWRNNDMSDQQDMVHRAALAFGASYVLVLPGENGPVVQAFSPLEMTAVYNRRTDRYPKVAGFRRDLNQGGMGGAAGYGEQIVEWTVLDADNVTVYQGPADAGAEDYKQVSSVAHGMGIVPVVRFVNQMPYTDKERPVSEVEPLFDIQERITDITMDALTAGRYSAYRQKWIMGVKLDDAELDMSPASVLAFEAQDGEAEAKIGEFAQTTMDGYLKMKEDAVTDLAVLASLPLRELAPDVQNVSSEAIKAVDKGQRLKVQDRKRSFGEAWIRVLRLADLASGNYAAFDESDKSDVVWLDPDQDALTVNVAQALLNLAQVGCPPELMPELIPGLTQEQVDTWKVHARSDRVREKAVTDRMFQNPDQSLMEEAA